MSSITTYDKEISIDNDEEEEEEAPPTQEDCCNSGCTPCVFDIYLEKLEKKKKKQERTGEQQSRFDLLSDTKFKPFILLEKCDFGGCYSRLTFQPTVEMTMKIEADKDCNNMIATEKSCNRIAADKDCNMIPTDKDWNITSAEKDCHNMTAEYNSKIIKEQHISGFLPYTPGQHLTMKSWKITSLKVQQSTSKQKIINNLSESSSENAPMFTDEEDRLKELPDLKVEGKSRMAENLEDENYSRKLPKLKNRGQTSRKVTLDDQETENYTKISNQEDFKGNKDIIHDIKSGEVGSGNQDTPSLTENDLLNQDVLGCHNIFQAQNPAKFYPDEETIAPEFQNSIPNSKEAIMGNTVPTFITRDYTAITLAQNSSNCCFQIIIKYYQDGAMSQYLKSLKNGDTADFRGPYGVFKYLKNHHHLLAVCMGTGIAPIYTIFRSILDDETDETFIKMIYGCKDVSGILLRDELGEMAKFWNFSAEFYLTSGEGVAKFGEKFKSGRIRKSCIHDNLKPNQLVLICGSEAFNSEVVGYLTEFQTWKVEYFVF